LPSKHFLRNTVLLLNHIKILCESKLRICIATDAHLARALGKSTRQIGRYIQYLRDSDQLLIETSRLKKDKRSHKFFKQRRIVLGPKVDQKCFKQQENIRFVHFSSTIHGNQKRTLNKMFLKCVYIPNLPILRVTPKFEKRCSLTVPPTSELALAKYKTEQLREKKQKKVAPFVAARKNKQEQRKRELEALEFEKFIANSTENLANSTEMNQISPQYTSTENQAQKKSTENPLKQRRRLAKQRRLDKMHKKPKDLDVVLVPLNQHKTLYLRIRRKSSTDSQSAEHRGP